MWGFRIQFFARWGLLALAMALLAVVAFRSGMFDPVHLTQTELKIRVTTLAVKFENLGLASGLVLLGLGWFLLFLGAPSILLLPILLFALHPLAAFLVMVVLQTTATAAVWMVARRFGLADPLSPGLKSLMASLGGGPASLVFWPRLYVVFPLRSLDLMAVTNVPAGGSLMAHLLAATAAHAVRLAIHTGWTFYLLAVAVDFRPFPERDLGWFLALTAGEVLAYLFPKIPELNPASKEAARAVQSLAEQT